VNERLIATGIAFQALSDGNIIVEFQDDSGKAISTQIIAPDLLYRIQVVTEMAIAVNANEKPDGHYSRLNRMPLTRIQAA
jgi:hypothetical protein